MTPMFFLSLSLWGYIGYQYSSCFPSSSSSIFEPDQVTDTLAPRRREYLDIQFTFYFLPPAGILKFCVLRIRGKKEKKKGFFFSTTHQNKTRKERVEEDI